MKSKWIKCARRKKEMRANKSWLKFTADYKVYKMAAAASVRQQPQPPNCVSVRECSFCVCVCVCALATRHLFMPLPVARPFVGFSLKLLMPPLSDACKNAVYWIIFASRNERRAALGKLKMPVQSMWWLTSKAAANGALKNLRRHNVALSQCAQRICTTFSKCFCSFLYLFLSLIFYIWQESLKAREWTLKNKAV